MNDPNRGLRILHILRAPVGGLFRHVLDLSAELSAKGHSVGLIADSLTGGEIARQQFNALAPLLKLGVYRLPMRREPNAGDFLALARVYSIVRRLKPDVVHGHGSKGGFYARASAFLPGGGRTTVRAYTPHGGAFHDQPGRSLYLRVERFIERKTDLFLFESDYIAQQFHAGVGETHALTRVAKNGLWPREFTPVVPLADAVDFVYVGELSPNKGVDTLIEAIAILRLRRDLTPRLAIVGAGSELGALADLVEARGLASQIAFYGAMPAVEAFRLGKTLVTPSRAESLPYVVLEAGAARVPIIATNVGGISEIFGADAGRLIPCDQPDLLADAMAAMLEKDPETIKSETQALTDHIATSFSLDAMATNVLEGYRAALDLKRGVRPAAGGAA